MSDDRDDLGLAVRACGGDVQALETLIQRHRLALFAQAYAGLRHYEDASDAVASAVVQVCLHIGGLRRPEDVGRWMRAIVRNECHRLRRGAQDAPLPLIESLPLADRAAGGDHPSLLRLDVERALARMPAAHAQAVRLYHLEGLPVAEVARQVNRPQGTVKYWLHVGRHALAQAMEGYGTMTTEGTTTENRRTTPMTTDADMTTDAETGQAPPTALFAQSDLPGPLRERVQAALGAAGYQPKALTREEVGLLLEELRTGEAGRLKGWVADCALLVMDEQIGGRSALEVLSAARTFGRAEADLPMEPRVCVLSADPWASLAFACWKEGVDLLVDTRDEGEMDRLADSFGRWRRPAGGLGLPYTKRAKYVLVAAGGVAAHLGQGQVGPEHLALVLLKEEDCAAHRLLRSVGLEPGQARQMLLASVRRGDPLDAAQAACGPAIVNALDMAYVEAWRAGALAVTSAHVLIGLLRAGDDLFLGQGVTLDAVRAAATRFVEAEMAENVGSRETEAQATDLHAYYYGKAAAYTTE